MTHVLAGVLNVYSSKGLPLYGMAMRDNLVAQHSEMQGLISKLPSSPPSSLISAHMRTAAFKKSGSVGMHCANSKNSNNNQCLTRSSTFPA